MRQLLFKNLTSDDRKKKDVYVQESIEKNGILATSERRCIYFIKEKIRVKSFSDLPKLTELKRHSQNTKRNFHVMKVHDSRTGTDKLICKSIGTLYAVAVNSIYCIVYVNSFKITFQKVALEGK